MRDRITIKVLTVGCKTNFADSATLLREAAAAGFAVVAPREPADVIVVNGCTVTHRADRDSRALVRRAKREHPGATVVMAGCYANIAPRRRGADPVPEVDRWLVSARENGAGSLPVALRELLGARGGAERAPGGGCDSVSDFAADLLLGHRRTFLKVQDGCDFACAYCIVPAARGRSRSIPAQEAVERAVVAEAEGAREIVLTGVHLGLYGAERGEREGLAALLERLLRATSLVRVRLGSLEPMELSERLAAVAAGSPRVCRHFHVPLQSGSDRILARMRRPYGSRLFLEAVERIARMIPGVQIGADVIAGFPGEGEEDFAATLSLLRDAPVDYLHPFPYSRREGTESAAWRDDVSPAEKKARVRRLLEHDRARRLAFHRRQVGQVLEVLAEKARGGRGELSGRADNYAEVFFPGPAARVGEVVPVRVAAAADRSLAGVPA